DRRHPVRRGPPDHPRGDEVPRARDLGGDRAQDQGRPGQALHRAAEVVGRRPDVSRPYRRRDRTNDHLGDGRAASRDHRRAHAPGVQGRRQRGTAAGGLPRDGVLAGYPMVDVKVELVDGSYHDVDSSEMAFKIAGSMAVKEAARQAHPVLLEPIMDVEVVTPSDYMGDVIGDLSSRRGKIGGMTQRADAQVVAASVPLSEMFGYSTTLRSMSQGRAIYSMQFSHYQEVPKAKAEEIVSKVKG